LDALYLVNTQVLGRNGRRCPPKRVEALEKIKENALERAKEGADSFEVRDFVTEAKKELAYQLPDEEAFRKAVRATQAYKGTKEG
jgi:acyl carrier protein